ncbi:MAG: ParB/RepB/Spo0J family partition protein [Ruminococcus sp.]|nr:ParB/RepB/Spo0J family partition protein [Ruminococcus sp.]MDE7225962.1 ParB/RepB/Spo0J family partition protein [Ruminococcus sp.]
MGFGGLGSGLDSLFSDNAGDVQVKSTLRTSEIEPNRSQPRKNFSIEGISSLADSIREHGILQPILVRPLDTGNYQIVAGERRWRAARMLGLDEIPVQIRQLTDSETMQIAIIENLQRENLNPVEEAMGYEELISEYGMTQEQVGKIVGKSRSAVANMIRILTLPEDILVMLKDGDLTVGHAKVLLRINDPIKLQHTASRAADGGMTVRQLERYVISLADEDISKKAEAYNKVDNYFMEMEISLKERLGRKVKVDFSKNKGALILEFYDKEDLAVLAEKLTAELE